MSICGRPGVTLKCKKCRSILVDHNKNCILNSHCEPISTPQPRSNQPCRDKLLETYYLEELELPDWIYSPVTRGNWQKGKLNCPSCDSRVGSFDFISGTKCCCDQFLVPPIRIVRSKVDLCPAEGTSMQEQLKKLYHPSVRSNYYRM